jgi:hypothetical protein
METIAMTALLNKAFKRAQGLPELAQDEVAQRVLAYVEKLEGLRRAIAQADARGGDAALDMSGIKATARRRLKAKR